MMPSRQAPAIPLPLPDRRFETMQQVEARTARYRHLLACPNCQGELSLCDDDLKCRGCGHSFSIEEEIPLLFWPIPTLLSDDTVTNMVRSFYEQHPFPDYEEFDDLASLIDKARQGVFARLLDEQIPFGSRILECGCGTGQLSNFLGISHRTVFGTDLSLNSLRLAESFRSRQRLDRVFFLQMNLFQPAFQPASFDFVICNGVLHHTADPRRGLSRLAHLLRPGGYLIIGLYHQYARLANDLRRTLLRWTGHRLTFLDPRLRCAPLGERRKKAWIEDQYRNPLESKHTIGEVFQWLEPNSLEWVKSIPKTRLLETFSAGEKLFEPDIPGSSLERFLIELSHAFRPGSEGGFFTMIARKKE